ncbi:hypothetical protein RRG08_050044 [Elysia crispata]|uniref:Uncharacterized protein n=1 Tax=Elysia crispata TaxID=231223 RepID=A0AAE1B9V4_9GAST|nr:hypothetical protein RRG08_050044 [Elysia crispata]
MIVVFQMIALSPIHKSQRLFRIRTEKETQRFTRFALRKLSLSVRELWNQRDSTPDIPGAFPNTLVTASTQRIAYTATAQWCMHWHLLLWEYTLFYCAEYRITGVYCSRKSFVAKN